MEKLKILTSVVIIIVLSGCSNHIRVDTLSSMNIERSPAKTTYFLSVDNEIIQNSTVKIFAEKQDEVEVTQSENIVKNNVSTPYEGLRELWEFPSGVIMLPVGIVVNLIDFATLGLIPNRLTDSSVDYALAGMNPFMNVEDEERTEIEEISKDSKVIDQHKEVTRTVAANTILRVTSSNRKLQDITTNSKGQVRISLFDEPYLEDIEKLSTVDVSIGESIESKASVNLLLTKTLRSRLVKSRKAINQFQSNQTGEGLAKAIVTLENLNFPRAALELERSILSTHDDEDFATDYEKATMILTNP